MPIGGGKYDREVEKIIQEVEGDLVLLLVVGGKRGNGFSVCARPPEGLRHMAALPDILAYCSGGNSGGRREDAPQHMTREDPR